MPLALELIRDSQIVLQYSQRRGAFSEYRIVNSIKQELSDLARKLLTVPA
jgi:hypothetical protein